MGSKALVKMVSQIVPRRHQVMAVSCVLMSSQLTAEWRAVSKVLLMDQVLVETMVLQKIVS